MGLTHVQALQRLWLLYRRPDLFKSWLEDQTLRNQLYSAWTLGVNALPHIIWLSILIGYTFRLLVPASDESPEPSWIAHVLRTHGLSQTVAYEVSDALVGVVLAVASGIVIGTVLGTIGGISRGASEGIATGIATGTVLALALGVTGGVSEGIPFSIALGTAGGISVGVVFVSEGVSVGLALGIVLALVIGISDGILDGVVLGTVTAISTTRAYYLLTHIAFLLPRPNGSFYKWHPIAWDSRCSTPMPLLDAILVDYSSYDWTAANVEIDRLIDEYPSQRVAALRAKCRLILRNAASEKRIMELPRLLSRLPQGESGWLAQTEHVQADLTHIAELQSQAILSAKLPALFLRRTQQVRDELNSFHSRVSGLDEPLASECRKAAEVWISEIEHQLKDARDVASREQVPQVFRAGDPVDIRSEAFIPRHEVVDELASHISVGHGCPGILLYARRRMGKSSCIRNLRAFLPDNISVLHINLQSPISTSEELFCRNLQSELSSCCSLPKPSIESDANMKSKTFGSTLFEFSRFLDVLDNELGVHGRKILIGLDEYEYLDAKLAQGLISEDLLSLFRTSIQRHRNLVWLFAGSHRIQELPNAEWPSYLISVQTIEVDRFSLEETTAVLTNPLEHSTAWPKGDPSRPRFEPDFWGENGIERMHRIADGWPHLLILLASTLVSLVNQRNVVRVDDQLLSDARKKSIITGETVMLQLLRNESRLPGEWDYLLGFKSSDSQPPPCDRAILDSLLNRTLVTANDGDVRLRVPLMQQWLRERCHFIKSANFGR